MIAFFSFHTLIILYSTFHSLLLLLMFYRYGRINTYMWLLYSRLFAINRQYDRCIQIQIEIMDRR